MDSKKTMIGIHRAAVFRIWIALLAILASICPVGPTASAGTREDVTSLAELLVQHGYTQGIAVVLVEGAETSVLSYGSISGEPGRKPDGRTVFEIGSVTKVLTSLALADMVEKGMLGLDDPVARYLPGEVKVPRFEEREITLLDLAAHVSGLPRMPDNFNPQNPNNPYADFDAEKLYEYLAFYRLPRAPGSLAEYSNLGAGLLGHALARRAGVSYEALIVGRICTVLSMRDTSISLSPEQKARFIQGYSLDGEPVPPWDFSVLAGAGAFHSTAEDLALFLKANMGLTESPLAAAIEATHLARAQSDMEGWKIGLAWQVSLDGQTAWHNGGTFGFYSFVGLNKNRQLGIGWLSNSALWQITEVNTCLLDILAGKPLTLPKLKAPAVVDASILDGHAGEYLAASDAVLKIWRDGSRLVIEVPGGDKSFLYPQSEERFFFRELPSAEVLFTRDEAGKTTKIIMTDKDGTKSAEKVK